MNIIKKTSNALKEVSLTLIFIGALLGSSLSVSANATSIETIESSITQFIVNQSDQMLTDISDQLEYSIAQQIQEISARLTLEQLDLWSPSEVTENAEPMTTK